VKVARPDTNVVTAPETSLGQIAGQSGAGVLAASYAYDAYTGQMDGFTTNLSYDFSNTPTASTSSTLWASDQRTGMPTVDSVNAYNYSTSRQLISVSYPGGHAGFTPIYDNAGNVTGEPGKWQATGFDELGRPTGTSNTEDGKTWVTGVSYTALQQLNQTIFGSAGGTSVNYGYYPSAGYGSTGSPEALKSMTITPPDAQAPVTTNYAYGSVDKRLKTITVNGIAITYAYQPDSDQVQSITAGNIATTYTPDSTDGARVGQVNVTDTSTSSTLFNESITSYNAQDQRTNETVSRVNVANDGGTSSQTSAMAYAYDPAQADALTGVTDNGSTVASFSYDAVGNRIGGVLGYPYGFAALNSSNTYQSGIVYDGGRETDDSTTSYTYDGVNRLASATPNNSVKGSLQSKFGYDNPDRGDSDRCPILVPH
jgi:YD repeat-containing protein